MNLYTFYIIYFIVGFVSTLIVRFYIVKEEIRVFLWISLILVAAAPLFVTFVFFIYFLLSYIFAFIYKNLLRSI